MADNITVTPGTGTSVATDDVGGVHYQKIKIALGPENTAGALKESAFTAALSGTNNVFITAVTGKKLRVISAFLSAAGQVDVQFQANQVTNLTGKIFLDTRGGIVFPFNPHGWFETAAGLPMNLSLSAAIQVGGLVTYIEI